MVEIENFELKDLLKKALDKLYQQDKNLLIDLEGMEMPLVFRFGVYFQELIKGTKLEGLNVDCEYNKSLKQSKRIPSRANPVRPDLVLHKRISHEENILIVEFKGHWNESQSISNDYTKLEDFTRKIGEYKYQLGVSVVFHSDHCSIAYFVDGKKSPMNTGNQPSPTTVGVRFQSQPA